MDYPDSAPADRDQERAAGAALVDAAYDTATRPTMTSHARRANSRDIASTFWIAIRRIWADATQTTYHNGKDKHSCGVGMKAKRARGIRQNQPRPRSPMLPPYRR